jgi:hypothetical protein
MFEKKKEKKHGIYDTTMEVLGLELQLHPSPRECFLRGADSMDACISIITIGLWSLKGLVVLQRENRNAVCGIGLVIVIESEPQADE